MIEIIREEEISGTTEKRGLPKDIKQIGRPDIGDRIYVENQVYQFLHPYNSLEEKKAYVLLGRFENYSGCSCVFVEAAIPLTEIDFDGELPLWSDQTWAYIYKQLKREYDNMVIVGWAMDIKGQLPNMTVRLENLHQQNFGGAHQVLYLMDSLECEEAFYGNRNGHLYRREGFYIYYEKHAGVRKEQKLRHTWEKTSVEELAVENSGESIVEVKYSLQEEPGEAQNTQMMSQEENHMENIYDAAPNESNVEKAPESFYRGNYRKQMSQEQKTEHSVFSSYATTVLLFAVVCVLGTTAYLNHEKMDAMEEVLARINQTQMAATEQETEADAKTPAVAVETVKGNVQKQSSQSVVTQNDAEESDTDTEGNVTDFSAGNVSPEMEGAAVNAAQAEAELTGGMTAEESADSEMGTTTETKVSSEAETAEETEVSDGADKGQIAATEAQTYLSQGYYIVQKGDSLVSICKKIYQTTAMLDKLCEMNGIENQDAIYAGQYLTLPN